MKRPTQTDAADGPALPTSATYPIRAVSLMTGVSIDTLRAWERRYRAVTPVRDGRGRLYTDADVRRVQLLNAGTAKGFAIGRIAHYTVAQLELLTESARPPAAPLAESSVPARGSVESMIASAERFDAAAVETELARAAAMLPISELLRDVVVPLLSEIGVRWHDGRAQIAHEHLLSASVRNVLGSLLRLHQKAHDGDAILFATPAGEPHELGALGAAVLAASGGVGTIYLGPRMPAADILSVRRVTPLRAVVLGVTDARDVAGIDDEVTRIAAELPADIELWLGGNGASRLAHLLGGRALAVPTYDVLETQLRRVGGRF
jgi:DNA-binding transcriptional MerR regulator